MPYHPVMWDDDLPHGRRRLRLARYDYTRPGAYFVTICVQDRLPLLATVRESEMELSPAGQMVAAVWGQLGQHYRGVEVDVSVVMPNHLHGVITLRSPDAQGEADGGNDGAVGIPVRPLSLSTLMRRFKTYTTHLYGKGVRSQEWPRYSGTLWQKSFYEHIIRSERDLHALRAYILANPSNWRLDRENIER